MGFVLRQYRDAPNPGIEAIGEGEVDDAKLAAERYRRLGPFAGQGKQPAAIDTLEEPEPVATS